MKKMCLKFTETIELFTDNGFALFPNKISIISRLDSARFKFFE